MDADKVFKVPCLKKKRPSLYCRETLDGLDDIWKQNNKTAENPESLTKPVFDCHNTMSSDQNRTGREASNSNAYAEMQDPSYRSQGPALGQMTPHSKYAYAVGLLNELCMTMEGPDDKKNIDSEQSKISNSSNATNEMFPDCSGNDGDVDMTTLIIPDESLVDANAEHRECELDWDSLTPPAPRSPGDHTVPDLYDLEYANTPSDCLAYSYDYLASVRHPISNPAVSGYRPHYMLPRTSSNLEMSSIPTLEDHIVPDFYI